MRLETEREGYASVFSLSSCSYLPLFLTGRTNEPLEESSTPPFELPWPCFKNGLARVPTFVVFTPPGDRERLRQYGCPWLWGVFVKY